MIQRGGNLERQCLPYSLCSLLFQDITNGMSIVDVFKNISND